MIEIDNEKAVGWLRNGAPPTERVEKLLKITGAWDEFKGQPVGTSGAQVPKVEEAVVEEAATEATEGDEDPS